MTFQELWEEFNAACPLNITDKEIAEWFWDAATKVAIPEGYVLVPIEPTEDYWEEVLRKKYLEAAIPEGCVPVLIGDLKQIEEAMAWELGGEPIHSLLVEAQKTVRAMIKTAQEKSSA